MPARADAGFTLLEVTIAFAIAALSLGAFYGGVAGGLRATGTAARYQAAPARAQSRAAAYGAAGRSQVAVRDSSLTFSPTAAARPCSGTMG